MGLFSSLKTRLKYGWLLVAFAIVTLILWNTNILFQNLKIEERKKVELWANAQKESIQSQSVSNFTFEVLQQTGINPMLQVGENEKIIAIKNIPWDSEKDDSLKLYEILKKIKKENSPIPIQFRDETGQLIVNQQLYYGDSIMLKKLQYYPMAMLLVIILFGSVLYFGFKTSKVSEQNRLWVAMAKETAHQIGTPLSSMMGWITLLKEQLQSQDPLIEIEKDIHRLQMITDRFSKIGSKPNLENQNIVATVQKTVQYLQQRSSEHIDFKITLPEASILLPHNLQLLSWTLENLIVNGIDAMKGKGVLTVQLIENHKGVELYITDNGSGIKKEQLSKIFQPGYTTKTRGWGLGLSLAKRIIVDYHDGKISVKKTEVNKGTTFLIQLKKDLN